MRAYRDDLAYIHDVGHGDFARRAAPGLLDLLRSRGITSGLVVDLGCGSGIWAQELVRAGYQVLGIDISPAMIALARRRAPAAEFRVASLLTAELPSCVAVTSIGECLNFRFDRNTATARQRLFQRIHRALQPGGLLVFDVLQPGFLRRAAVQRRCREGPDWAVLVEVEEDRRRARLTRRITSFRKIGRLYRRDSERHEVQLLRAAELASQLRQVGFRVTRLRGYGQLRFQGPHIGLAARKPSMRGGAP
jgi:SAM-dependent methyltransferase